MDSAPMAAPEAWAMVAAQRMVRRLGLPPGPDLHFRLAREIEGELERRDTQRAKESLRKLAEDPSEFPDEPPPGYWDVDDDDAIP